MENPDTHLPEKKKSTQREAGRVSFRGGSYSLLISLVVLVLLVSGALSVPLDAISTLFMKLFNFIFMVPSSLRFFY